MQTLRPRALQVWNAMQIQPRAYTTGMLGYPFAIAWSVLTRLASQISLAGAAKARSRPDKSTRQLAQRTPQPQTLASIPLRASDEPIIDGVQPIVAPILPTNQATKPKPKRGELPCYKWQKTGACPKGDKCWYAHDPAVCLVFSPWVSVFVAERYISVSGPRSIRAPACRPSPGCREEGCGRGGTS